MLLIGQHICVAQSKRDCIVATAKKEVGLIEIPNNRGKRIDEYRSLVLRKPVKNYSDAWCGYFAGWVYLTCGVKPKTEFSPRAKDWFTNSKLIVYRANFQRSIIGKTPQRGDVIGYKFHGGEIGHIEILIEWHEDEEYFISIGGNTSNKNSVYRDLNNSKDGVRMKKRSIDTAYLIANHID